MPVSLFIRNQVSHYDDAYAHSRYAQLISAPTWNETSEELQALADRFGVKLQWYRCDLTDGEWKEVHETENA